MTATMRATPDTADTLGHLSGMCASLAEAYLAAARETLRTIVSKPQLVEWTRLDRRQGAYTRTLLFDDRDMSVWAMNWAPGASTPIHDHHCSCCFAVIRGEITEAWYDMVEGTRANLTCEAVRRRGYVAAMLPSGPNIHQMRNDSPDFAVSVHIYGFNPRLHPNSVRKIYSKG
ncbi:MAG: cysteine dioxygenase family protein [Parvibaculaceae bacterium]